MTPLVLIPAAFLAAAMLATCVEARVSPSRIDENTVTGGATHSANQETVGSISGYEGYTLNQPVESSVLARFVGPKRDKSQPEIQVYKLEEDFADGHHVWCKDTTLASRDGLLKAVFVDYKPPPELRSHPKEAWPFVEKLRQDMVKQHGADLIAKDKFYLAPEAPGAKSWMGALQMKDGEGRELVLIWTGERAMISCWGVDILRETNEEIQAERERELPRPPLTPSL